MQKKFLIIFSIFNFLAFGALLVYKFVNAPVHVKIERTSVMNVEEKKELVTAVLNVISNHLPRIGVITPSPQNEIRPIQISGKIYQYGANYYYYLDGYHFSEGEIFPFDCSQIVSIHKLSLQTEKGLYFVNNTSSPLSSSASSVSSSSRPTENPFQYDKMLGGVL